MRLPHSGSVVTISPWEVTVPGLPLTKSRATQKDRRNHKWAKALRKNTPKGLRTKGDVQVHLHVTAVEEKGLTVADVDNYAKVILDLLEWKTGSRRYGILHDDGAVIDLRITKEVKATGKSNVRIRLDWSEE